MYYQNCIFDLYGTLVDIHTDEGMPVLWEQMAASYREQGADYAPEELRDAYFSLVREKEHDQLRQDAHEAHPEIQIETVFQALYQRKGVWADLNRAAEMGRLFRARSTEYLRLYDGAETLLRTLKEQGRGVFLLSNAQRIFTEQELKTLGLDFFFDAILISSDYGCKKPDRRFFERLLHGYRIDPKNAIMIGNDGVCDIQGAQGVGLATLYIRSNISPKEPLPQADYVLEEMNLHRVREILCNPDR